MDGKLIPFDFAEFCKDPMRLRFEDGSSPNWAEPVRDCIAVQHHDFCYTLYQPALHSKFRLAAKTRKVSVRLLETVGGNIFSRTADDTDLTAPTYCNNPWVSDIIEVEITE